MDYGLNDLWPDGEAYLAHYGTPRHSGRYPWGSGKNPQRSKNFLQREKELKEQGLSEKEIANAFGISTGELRARHSIASNEKRLDDIAQVTKLRDKGMGLAAISERTGLSVSTISNYLNKSTEFRANKTITIADNLEKLLKEKPYLDVGEGVERQLGISEVQLSTALEVLKDRGFTVTTIRQPQATNPSQKTEVRVLAGEGVTAKELYDNRAQITSPDGLYFEDYGSLAHFNKPPTSIDSKRIQVRYAEDGGIEKDGVIEIRPGVEDISLGGRTYAQVRIQVDGTHYLKGMAVYGYNMPPGADIVFNTNKHKDTPMMGEEDNTVLKPVKNDPLNPFGAAFNQWEYVNSEGKKVQSPVNIVNDDESWDKWQKTLSSQFLSKQPVALARQQLNLDVVTRENDLKDILSIPNPTVKRQLLQTYADECDSAAVHMKGAALPRQGTFAILPVSSLKSTEVFAPQYEQGEEVVLIRFPHAGTFEIPRLRVNNENKEANAVITKSAQHAIGINYEVAAQLSGADYDGDTVLVIPTKGQNIRTRSPLLQLKDFDPKELYRNPPEAKKTGEKGEGFNKQMEMGEVSNLITDMQIKGADLDEIARAVKHSMTVIDAEKHNLNWRQSEIDNNIAELRLKYQGKITGGASTLLSRRKRSADIPYERTEIKSASLLNTEEEREKWDNGEKVYRETGRMYKPGKYVKDPVTKKTVYVESNKLVRAPRSQDDPAYAILETDDVNKLSTGTPIETVYANYANTVKRLAREARMALRSTGKLVVNPEAKRVYEEEVKSINTKLNNSALNAPKERQAQLIAGSNINAIKQANPELKLKENKDKLSKMSNKELAKARTAVGAKRHPIVLTEREWEAIEAGAISDTKLTQVLRYADIDAVRKLATPKTNRGLSQSSKARARALLKAGHTQSEVANTLGVSVSTLNKELNS